eukprot:TRINITY_DN42661_c0_g1_i2.p1 TRINITY_DN42661_c0_g1~~TRINITY_DN42661_c0_g1_i2.p1  ORF type:complete len:107 (-),score=4.02 TRINITY_DN42661_c0_g1_i2:88-408(-)
MIKKTSVRKPKDLNQWKAEVKRCQGLGETLGCAATAVLDPISTDDSADNFLTDALALIAAACLPPPPLLPHPALGITPGALVVSEGRYVQESHPSEAMFSSEPIWL